MTVLSDAVAALTAAMAALTARLDAMTGADGRIVTGTVVCASAQVMNPFSSAGVNLHANDAGRAGVFVTDHAGEVAARFYVDAGQASLRLDHEGARCRLTARGAFGVGYNRDGATLSLTERVAGTKANIAAGKNAADLELVGAREHRLPGSAFSAMASSDWCEVLVKSREGDLGEARGSHVALHAEHAYEDGKGGNAATATVTTEVSDRGRSRVT